MPPLPGIDGRSNDIPMFRCGKGTTFEGGMRVPGVISLRSTLKPATTAAVFSHMDILPLSILHPSHYTLHVITVHSSALRGRVPGRGSGPRAATWRGHVSPLLPRLTRARGRPVRHQVQSFKRTFEKITQTFVSVSQFHVYLPWVNTWLA